MLKQPAVKAEYDAQREEFTLLDELLKARRKAGLAQADVAVHRAQPQSSQMNAQ
jgi:hypothetical protein